VEKRYALIVEGDSITLVILHDENHPEVIALFPNHQRPTAEFICDFLNKDISGISLEVKSYQRDK
jgi:hypothetical protein